MKTNDKIFLLIERYVNDHKKHDLFEFYGVGTEVIVKSIGYSTNHKSLYVEAHLIIGEDFSDDIIDTSLVELLIGDSMKYLYPNVGVSYIITFDS